MQRGEGAKSEVSDDITIWRHIKNEPLGALHGISRS